MKDLNMKAITQWERKKDLANIYGLMDRSTRGIGLTIGSMGAESTCGRTAGNIMVSGSTMTWRATVSIYGQMADGMKDNITMTRKKGMVHTIGQTADAMRDGGSKGSSTDLEYILILLRVK